MANPNIPPGPGRPKGVPNRFTQNAKAALQAAFDGIGGVPKLIEWASENPTDFYKLYAKLIPVEVNAQVATASHLVIEVYGSDNPGERITISPSPEAIASIPDYSN